MDSEALNIFLRNLGVLAMWLGSLLFLLFVCSGIYFALSIVLKRQERARLFVDLLESGLRQGRSPEQTIVSLAKTREKSFDVWFYLLAGYVEQGYRLDQALEKVPCFLPARVRALLQAGQELGDLRKIFPVARKALQDGASDSLVGQNNLGVVLFALPVGPVVLGVMSTWVLPRFKELIKDMIPGGAPMGLELFHWSQGLAVVSAAVWLLFYIAMALQNGGPRFVAWLEGFLWSFLQRLELRLPWRYKRLQRDFSALLGLLLDAGLPEQRALQVAAEGTGNWFFQQRAQAAIEQMRQGARLTEAVQSLDKEGEFRWRLENAAAGSAGFTNALAGWQESLDAKAFAQQQAVSQLITTGLVFINGAMVALLAVGFFAVFLAIMGEAPLW